MTRQTSLALLASAVLGCGADPPAEGRRQPALLGNDEAAADTLERHLIARHRELIDALRLGNGAALGRMIEADFTATDTRQMLSNATSLYSQSESLSYVEVMSGRFSARLSARDESFDAVPDGDRMLVFGIGSDHGVRSVWRRLPDGWKASQLMILSPVAAKQLMEEPPR